MSVSQKRVERRRRRANSDQPRAHRHVVKVTPQEEAKLVRLAEEQHVSVARLLMESTLKSDGGFSMAERQQIRAELFAIRRLLGATSLNVNQLAVHANSTGEVKREAAATIAYTRGVIEQVVNWIEDDIK